MDDSSEARSNQDVNQEGVGEECEGRRRACGLLAGPSPSLETGRPGRLVWGRGEWSSINLSQLRGVKRRISICNPEARGKEYHSFVIYLLKVLKKDTDNLG